MFKDMTTEGLEKTQDRLGGRRLLPSGIYTGKIKIAYAGESQSSSAQSVTTVIDYELPDGSTHEMTETVWVTNAKGEHFYPDKNDSSKKRPMVGFDLINSLCLVTTGHPLPEMDIEKKAVEIWDYDAGKKMPQQVPVITNLIGEVVTAAIFHEKRNKQKKNDSTGKYESTNDAYESNATSKYFHAESGRTVLEIMEDQPAQFMEQWKERFAGQVRDLYKEVSEKGGRSNNARSGSPSSKGSGGGGGLFAKK